MKKVVWENKSNSQLCVTIPKGSGLKVGDMVNIEKEKIRKIVYSLTTGDLFNYGQLKLLENANKLGDFHICGILTDDAIKSYKKEPVANLRERVCVISSLRCVDMVMTQYSKDSTENLKKIHKQFPNSEIIIVHGSNWRKIPGDAYIKKIGGRIIRPPFYKKLSTDNIVKKIFKIYRTDKESYLMKEMTIIISYVWILWIQIINNS